MTDEQPNRLEPLRQLAEASDDARLLDQVMATVEVLEKDTALVLDQTHIARGTQRLVHNTPHCG